MLRILLALLLMTSSAWAVQWRAGTGENSILGSSNASDIDFNSYNSIVNPLDNLLATYCNEYLTYGSSSTIKVSVGSVVVSNSQGTIRLFLKDSAISTLSSSNLDTGAFVANTTYYVYATAATNSSTSSTYFISASNTSPSGQTYYYQIGSFATDSSNQIINIINNLALGSNVQTYSSKSSGVTYQALTDGMVEAVQSGGSGNVVFGYTDSSSSPTTLVQENASLVGASGGISFIVRKGDYYKVTTSGSASATVYFVPTSK